MTYSFGDITVTTWRRTPQGEQIWRVRGGKSGDLVAEFIADRDSDPLVLHRKGIVALASEHDRYTCNDFVYWQGTLYLCCKPNDNHAGEHDFRDADGNELPDIG